jgi:SLOG cluster2/TIR domain
MAYQLPLQLHVIWHPASNAVARPLAEKIYLALNHDAYQPLVPGIGIPVFFRYSPRSVADSHSAPAPIVLPDTEFDLRVMLLTPELVMDPAWVAYRAQNTGEVRDKGSRAALVSFGLAPGMADGASKVVQLDRAGTRMEQLLLQHVLLQACRLLGHRNRPDMAVRGAAPLKLFLSHTKRDKIGLETALALKKYLDTMAVDRFFDEVSIQPGDDISQELAAEIDESVLVAIRTDGYVASPWCRKELALAKRSSRPMVVLDALTGTEPRSSVFMSNLPSIRIDPNSLTPEDLDRLSNFIGLEVLRFLHATRHLSLLKSQGLLPADALVLPRPPESRDFGAAVTRDTRHSAATSQPIVVHPDPVLAAEEAEDFSMYHATLVTPITLWHKRLDGLQLGISASTGDLDELGTLGLSALHIEDAVRIVARQALAAGATLVYGGALAPGNFTEALFEMIGAYNKGGLVAFPRLVNYAAWPWSEEVDTSWLALRRQMLENRPCEPPDDAKAFSAGEGRGHVARLAATTEGRYALSRSLSAMRSEITQNTHARIVLGGKLHGYSGLVPGIIEEVLLAARRKQPLYILGGFGGAARLAAAAISHRNPELLTRERQRNISDAYSETLRFYESRRSQFDLPDVDFSHLRAELERCGISGLAETNGLSPAENEHLFHTGSVETALQLTMKGLSSIQNRWS